MPRKKCCGKFSDAFEAVREETDDAEEGVNDNDDVCQLGASPLAEACLNPLGAGHHNGPPQPGREVNHQEYLVESRPQPRDPDALQSIDAHPVDQQHGAADVEHTRGVRDPEHIPRHDIPTEEVRFDIFRRAMRHPVAHQN